MKRILPVILTVLLILPILAMPAMAAETETNWVELLDYSTANDSGSNRVSLSPDGSTKTKTVWYDNPNGYSYAIVDVLFSTDDSTPEIGTASQYITVENVFGNTYRAYGFINSSDTRLTLRYTDGSYFQVYSFRVSIARYDWDYVDLNGTVSIYDGDGNGSFSYSDQAVRYEWERENGDNFYGGVFNISLNIGDWRKFDYIDVIFSVTSYSLVSIVCDWQYGDLPYTITELNNVDGSAANRTFVVHMDVTGLVRSNNYNPVIRITGDSLVTGVSVVQKNSIAIGSCIGYVQYENVDLLSYWFMQLDDWISSVSSSISSWGQSLQDSIDALPDKIAEALQAVFVPSEGAVESLGQQSQELAEDRFGGAYEGAMIIDQFASQLQPQQATQILTVPVVNLNILGVPFPLGGWEVDLVPEGSEIVVESCKIIIDILATCAFLNGIRNRLERTLEK